VPNESIEEDDDTVAAFVARGGEIQQLKPQRGPKRSGVSLASKHIGSGSGRGTTKGKVSGLGANTGKSGKPVVTAEQGVAEGKITLSTDPDWYGATVDNYQASGPVVNIPANQLVGFEPDDKMNQPKSKANVKKIVAGLKQGDKLPPLLVRKYKDGYQVLDGHHRFWAYKLLGVKSIPAQIVPAKDIEEISKQGVAEGICSLEEAHAIFDDFEQAMAARGLTEDAFDTITDEDIIRETAAWRRSAGKSKKGGLNRKGVASYRREHPGSHLQMAVTTKPSKLKPGSKAAKRRKSFCARMSGVQGPMKKPNGKPTRKALALRKWNC
jgi:hypothetical protein